MYIKTHEKLLLNCLNQEQHERTCGYWYTITADGSTPYTAFRTREALEFFLNLHGLKLKEPIPDEIGTWAWTPIEGKTREIMHGNVSEMPGKGTRVLHMSNGDYTVGIAEEDKEGVIIHFLGPNSTRAVFDPQMGRAHQDAGHKSAMTALINSAELR